MATSPSTRNALVAGAGRIIGYALCRELAEQGWQVTALARRPIAGFPSISADLTDVGAATEALRTAKGTTHVFYAALSPDPDLSTEAERNGRMLGNLLDGLEEAGAPLRRVAIYQGFKIYGIHLGAKVPTPARESDPPHMPPNIYLAQEAQLKRRAERSAWDYVALRPDVVVGDIHGNPMNIALVIGAFAEISRALDIPLRFPGTDVAYRHLAQFTDSRLLARASAWAAEAENAAGEAFNVTNGDIFRWERMWSDVAAHLGMRTAAPVPLTLARHMADKGPMWKELAEAKGLVQPDLGLLVGWGFGDFIFHTETDVISDVNKIYRYGFTERMNSTESLLSAIESLKRQRVLP
jgi:nucleoside-diphosphate-sugar epimerase